MQTILVFSSEQLWCCFIKLFHYLSPSDKEFYFPRWVAYRVHLIYNIPIEIDEPADYTFRIEKCKGTDIYDRVIWKYLDLSRYGVKTITQTLKAVHGNSVAIRLHFH